MYKFASREIDFHDNYALLDTLDIEVPDFVKKATPDSPKDVPMDRWAVVLVTPGKTFSKFALHNRAFTWVSAHLFPKTAQHLPTRARQVAAHFIKRACLEYRMAYPSEIDQAADAMEKISSNVLDMSEYQDTTALDYDKFRIGHMGQMPKALLTEKLQEYSDRDRGDIVSSQEMGEELASRIYSYAMNEGFSLPSASSLGAAATKSLPKGSKKSEVKGFFVDRIEQMEAAEKIKRASLEARRVGYVEESFGVTTKTADGQTVGRFQLNTPELVKRAEAFFLDNYSTMHPKYRKELADGIVKHASGHGMFVEDERIRSYCGDGYSDNMPGNVTARLSLLKGAEEDIEKAASTLKSLVKAGQAGLMSPEKFASALAEYDRRTGIDQAWDRHVKDPWLSTFEVTKEASWTFRMGDDVINEDQLRKFMTKHARTLDGYLQQHLISELQRYPTAIFDSLPRPEKEIILYKMQEAGVAG